MSPRNIATNPPAHPHPNARRAAGRRTELSWPDALPLFPPLPEEARSLLTRLPEALHQVRPLQTTHKRSLPEDVAALSQRLTRERAWLSRPYWSHPAAVSAYLHYFLPWNLVRLTRLLASLPLPDPRTSGPKRALFLDMGSGPLTLPLALWLARPQWRSAPISVLALDNSPQPLQLGRALMEALAALTGFPLWPIRTVRAPLWKATQHAAVLVDKGDMRPWLISAANVLNEAMETRSRRRIGEDHAEMDNDETAHDVVMDRTQAAEDDTLDMRLDNLLDSLAPFLEWPESANVHGTPWPALLFVEPGTRLGGGTIMRLRRLAVEGGLTILAPCTHQDACPLQRSRTWCHFTFTCEGAPAWLTQLSARAGLAKDSLSLSPLLISAPASRLRNDNRQCVRVLSSPLRVPGLRGKARYACSAQGLFLLEDAEKLACGDLLPASPGGQRDHKSGARIARPALKIPGHSPGRDK